MRAQLYPTLYNPIGSSPPGSSVRGTFPARIPKWLAISSFKDTHLPVRNKRNSSD